MAAFPLSAPFKHQPKVGFHVSSSRASVLSGAIAFWREMRAPHSLSHFTVESGAAAGKERSQRSRQSGRRNTRNTLLKVSKENGPSEVISASARLGSVPLSSRCWSLGAVHLGSFFGPRTRTDRPANLGRAGASEGGGVRPSSVAAFLSFRGCDGRRLRREEEGAAGELD